MTRPTRVGRVDDQGDVIVFGKNTREIRTDTEWLTSLDRFGLVSNRAVLLDQSEEVDGMWIVRSAPPKQEIARMIGASREMVSRVVKDLQLRGYIRAEKRKIFLLEISALHLRPRLQRRALFCSDFRYPLGREIQINKSRRGVGDLVIFRECTEGFYSDRNMYMGIGEFMPTEDMAIAVHSFKAGDFSFSRAPCTRRRKRNKTKRVVR